MNRIIFYGLLLFLLIIIVKITYCLYIYRCLYYGINPIDVDKVIALNIINNGPDIVNYYFRINGMSILHQACRNGDKELVIKLLNIEYSYHINTRDIYGLYPLHYAIHEGYYDISLLLLNNNNLDVNSRDYFGFTPLHYSILNGNKNLTDLLIEYNANISLQTLMGSSALLLSAKLGHDDISSNLLAASIKYVDSSDFYGFNSIYYAAYSGQEDLTKFLLLSGTNLNTTFYSLSPLHIAVREGRADFIFQLMNNTEGKKLNFKKDIFGETPLHKAGRFGRDFISFILLNAGADIEAKNIFHATPLHLATYNSRDAVSLSLVNKGANMNAKDIFYLTPVIYTTFKGPMKLVLYLILLLILTPCLMSFQSNISEVEVEEIAND